MAQSSNAAEHRLQNKAGVAGMAVGIGAGDVTKRRKKAITAIINGMQRGVMAGGVPAKRVAVEDFDS